MNKIEEGGERVLNFSSDQTRTKKSLEPLFEFSNGTFYIEGGKGYTYSEIVRKISPKKLTKKR